MNLKKENNNNVIMKFNSKYNFDSFVVGNSNKFAYYIALTVTELPKTAYNPFYIYGGSGCGKTHLLHSIGQALLEKHSDIKVLYITGEDFGNNECIKWDVWKKFSGGTDDKWRRIVFGWGTERELQGKIQGY